MRDPVGQLVCYGDHGNDGRGHFLLAITNVIARMNYDLCAQTRLLGYVHAPCMQDTCRIDATLSRAVKLPRFTAALTFAQAPLLLRASKKQPSLHNAISMTFIARFITDNHDGRLLSFLIACCYHQRRETSV